MTAPFSPPKSLGTVLVVGGCGFVGARVVDNLLNFPSENSLPAVASRSHNAHEAGPSSSYGEHKYPASLKIEPDRIFPSLRSRYPSYDAATTKVHALDLRCTRNRYEGCTYHEADITDAAELEGLFRQIQPDVVINTASPTFEAPYPVLRKVNIEGTRTLLRVAGATGVKAFVHTSSSSVVSDCQADLVNADERYPYVYPNARERYSETKVDAERLVLEASGGEGGMLTCAVRPAGVMGEGDRAGYGYGVCLTGWRAPEWNLHLQLGKNENLFDLTYVGNVAHGLLCAAGALRLAWERRKAGKGDVLDFERVDGEAFNVTNDGPVPFWDGARFLWTRMGRDVRLERVWVLPEGLASLAGGAAEAVGWLRGKQGKFNRQTVKYSCMSRWFSCDKLKRRTGYEPVVGVEEGLERTVRWFVEMMREEEGKKDK